MLRTRIVSAIIALILLCLVVWADHTVLGIAIFFLALVGVNEFYNAVKSAGCKPIRAVGFVLCLPILFFALRDRLQIQTMEETAYYAKLLALLFCAVIMVLLLFIVFRHERYNIIDIALTVFGAFYVVFLFSFIVLTRELDHGFYFIWLIFIGAFATDTAAYFTGSFIAGKLLGRHKLAPYVSPNKSVEGAIGGIIGCIVLTMVYGILINRHVGDIPYYHYIAIGGINGVLSQLGDLSASAIKRYTGIKDYGKLMPGHGGVLDRFDSILFTAPVVYFYISFCIR